MKRRNTLVWWWLANGVVVGALSTSALAQSDPKAKARQITAGSFLEAPPSFEGTDFNVADAPPSVWFVRIPLPQREADPWSIWGYSLIHSNGKVYVPLGDHRGVDGNSYLYEYNPETKVIRQVADVLSAVEGHEPGDFGYGKIHGRLNEGTDANIYFGTYWGEWNNGNKHYHGDRVLRYNPGTEELTDLGMPKFGWGFPSTHMAPAHNLFYAEAHKRKSNSRGAPQHNYLAEGYSPAKEMRRLEYKIRFLAYDVASKEVIYLGDHKGLSYGRDFFVDDKGKAYFNNGKGRLAQYDPVQNKVIPIKGLRMPAERIRRAVGPDKQGIMYGSTHEDQSRLFAFDPEAKEIRTIATTPANTAGMDVAPSGQHLYYVPGAHSPYTSVPVVQVNTSSGRQKVIAFLLEPVWRQTQYNLGGTYSVNVTEDGSTVYIAINGRHGDRQEHWGDLAFVAVEVPDSER